MNRILVVSGAKKRFGDVQALDGAGFEMAPGEMIGLLGPNGAGKTTLVRSIAGRVRLDDGTIELFGRRLAADDRRSELGFAPQEIALYPVLSARENLDGFGRLSGVASADIKERVDQALEWTGLADRANEPIRRFSGGMKRRLNIAAGVLHGPKLVMLDEPTVGVDPQSRERIYEMLEAKKREGVGILLTTHHLDEAESRCERIVIIDKGRTVAAGTLSELVERTVGHDRHVTIRTALDIASAPQGFTAQGKMLKIVVKDVTHDLPGVLSTVASAGHAIQDVEVRGPGLHAVFLSLTGKDLRE